MTIGDTYTLEFMSDNVIYAREYYKGTTHHIQYTSFEATSDKIIVCAENFEYHFEYGHYGWVLKDVKKVVDKDVESLKAWLGKHIELSYRSERETAIFTIPNLLAYNNDDDELLRLIVHPAKLEIVSSPNYRIIIQAKTIYFELESDNTQDTWRTANIGTIKSLKRRYR